MRRALLAAATVAAASAIASPPVRLDDSASPKARVELAPRWLGEHEAGANRDWLHAMVAEAVNVEIRLDTRAHVGRRGRIYLVVPDPVPGLASPTGLRVNWLSRGLLASGSAVPGSRTLVYDGAVDSPVTVVRLDFRFELDARYVGPGLRIDPQFEIEIVP
jgi:hypothetical protein